MTMPFKIYVDSLFELVLHSVISLSRDKQDDVIQTLAYNLEEWYHIPRDDLRSALQKIGFRLQERCVFCEFEMPSFNGTGDPICSDCDTDQDSMS
jgi:hypothetical protein